MISLSRGGPRDDSLRRQFVNLIRLTDLAVAEYERARLMFLESLPQSTNRLGSVFEGVDHAELCVITLHRAFLSFEKICRHKASPAIDKNIRRLIESFAKKLRPVRDLIVHIDNDISGNRIPSGHSHALLISEDGTIVSIGSNGISLSELGNSIMKLHEIAAELAVYKEE